MINSKELMLGNLVNHRNWRKTVRMIEPIVGEVTQISKRGFVIDHKWSGVDAEPISLTAEWLKRMGFEQERGYFKPVYFDKDMVEYLSAEGYENPDGIEIIIRLKDPSLGRKGRKVKYVHDVQNLFFALAGEELKISHIK